MELDVLPAASYFFYQKLFPDSRIVDISGAVRQLRMIKSPWEIEMMRGAAALSRVVADAVPEILHEGLSELELSAELELAARKAGHLGIVRVRAFNLEMAFGHVLSGADAALPSYGDTPTGGMGLSPAFGQGAGKRRIGRSEIVSVDIMMNFNGYLNDQTRNFCLGPPPEKLARAYALSREIHDGLRAKAGPGAVTGELYEEILRDVEKAGWADVFMGHGDTRVHFIGHGLGLEVDEPPFVAKGQKLALREGMTFAFEPKFIVPGLGVAGLENTYLVTGSGVESLNTAPEELLIL
jgi:Xaa-Pro aminopeptidase